MKTVEKNQGKKKVISFDYDPSVDEKIWKKIKKDVKKARAKVYLETYG